MKNRVLRWSVVVFLALFLGGIALGLSQVPPKKIADVQGFEIRGLTLQSRLEMVGKVRTIRGFYSDKSVPLIVDDINRMMVRQPLPAGSYVLLGGALPKGLSFGDRIEAQGVISKPVQADARHLRGEETILKIGRVENVKVLTKSTRTIYTVPPNLIQRLSTASAYFKVKLPPGTLQLPTHYAVLINGGINWPNYWVSFYNDLVIDYNMLLGRGYLPANIYVLNADGGGAPPGTTPCGTIPVNYAATSANVTTVFNQLADKMKVTDSLTVMITDHGGSGVICLWGENMSGTTFAGLVNAIPNYSQMTFAFDLCFSGGLVPQVLGANRLIYAACDADKSAYDSSLGHYGALNFALVSALTGITPAGAAVNADANGDGKISLAEAFNYARTHVNSGGSQTFHYNDDTAMPDVVIALPHLTDGILGAIRYL